MRIFLMVCNRPLTTVSSVDSAELETNLNPATPRLITTPTVVMLIINPRRPSGYTHKAKAVNILTSPPPIKRRENSTKPITNAITAERRCQDNMDRFVSETKAKTANKPMTRYVKTWGMVNVLTS